MEKYGFVYMWYDIKHKRYYVGSHWGNVDDGYICSSPWMKNSFKRRPNDFKRRLLSIVRNSRQDLINEEYKWLSLMKQEELGKRYYNLNNHIQNYWWLNEDKSLTVKQKVSNTKKKYWASSESDNNRKLLSELNKTNGIKPPSRTGKIPWNKGLTKKTDSRVMINSVAISKPKSNTEKMGKYDRSNPDYNIKNGKKAHLTTIL